MSDTLVSKAFGPLIDNLWSEIERRPTASMSKATHETYSSVRQTHVQAAYLATFAGDDRLPQVLESWQKLQVLYAKHVRETIKKKEHDFREEQSTYADSSGKLKPKLDEKSRLLNQLAESDDTALAERLSALTKEIKTLRDEDDAKTKATRALENLELACGNLSDIEKAGLDSINYAIPSAETIIEQLGKGEYKGIPVERFDVRLNGGSAKTAAKAALVTVVPARRVTAVGDLKVLAPELEALLQVRDAVYSFDVEEKLDPRKVIERVLQRTGKKEEDYVIPVGTIGTYLRKNPELFGVEDKGNYKLQRTGGPVKSDLEFIAGIKENLSPTDRASVNRFYILRALERMRNTRRGYEGFTGREVVANIESVDGHTMHFVAVGKGFSADLDGYGVEELQEKEGTFKVYRFKEVKPTSEQYATVEKGVKSLGIEEITPKKLFEKLVAEKEDIALRIVSHVLAEKAAELGLRKIKDSPPTYKSIATVTLPDADADVEADTDTMF